jgi:peptidoglycan hydrolase-like protein with peptidoglycan-binding domain
MRTRVIPALLIVVATFVGLYGSSASALSVGDIDSQIAKLRVQISELTARLMLLRAQKSDPSASIAGSIMPSKHRICFLLARDLRAGAAGDDVRGLQEFLYENKFLTVQPTGYFGELTASAVRKWQVNEGVSAVGAFGPLSRERLKIWCGGNQNQERFSVSPSRGEAPLVVVFETWLSGFRVPSTYYTIDYGDGTSERAADCPAPADACTGPGQNKHTYSSNGTYTATLNKITDPCPDDGNPNTPRCLAAIQSEVVAKQQIIVAPVACTKEYKPVCGAKPIVCITYPCNPIPTTYGNRCEMNADGASFLYEGQCRTENPADDPQCRNWFDGCNTCARNSPGEPAACTLKYCTVPGKAYCTARFNDSASNKPPVISGFSGPTTLNVDATGTWTLRASDPEGGALSYQVWWGDENVYASNYTTATAAREFTQSTSFTHSYSSSGTYTVKITVRDGAGNEARSSSTVRVTSMYSCLGDIEAARSYSNGPGMVCGQGGPLMQCPYDSNYKASILNTCASGFLETRGWTVVN